MPTQPGMNDARPLDRMRSLTIDVAIRIGLLALLAYWSLKVIGPFVTILLWSGILTVALYPVFTWLARLIGSKTLAAAMITVLSLMIVLGPVTWLGFAMVGGIELLVKGIDTGQLAIPMPPDVIKDWPLIGEKIFQLWSQAATNTEALLLQAAPYLKNFGGKLLSLSQGVAVGLIEFVGSIVIAGFLYSPGHASLISCARSFGESWGMKVKRCCSSSVAPFAMSHVGLSVSRFFRLCLPE
jgi:predicted PurR-regulated permease PerM